MIRRAAFRAVALAVAAATLFLLCHPALAEAARHPFAVTGGEAAPAGAGGGLSGLVIAWQNKFNQQLQAAVRALKTDPAAFWALGGASFAYGVFHAAGPGHGKAVLASYMIANETALKRGLVLAALAALLQGAVAILLVGAAALLLNATAQQMKATADLLETASYAAVALLGARLLFDKGRGFVATWRGPAIGEAVGRFSCRASDDPGHMHGQGCGHALDPALLKEGFSWTAAISTIVAAGLRPCSGAILVLVFTLSQGLFAAGVASTLLMAAGTAITTGAIACFAVFAKGAAMRLSRGDSRRALLLGRGAEVLAAMLVLGLGIALLAGVAARGAA